MQDGASSPSRYHAFLLRLSQPEPGAAWQIVLKTTDQDQPYLFRDAKALLEFLEMLMETEQSG
jgi:hypothetical protein